VNQRDFRGDPSASESVLNLARASNQYVSVANNTDFDFPQDREWCMDGWFKLSGTFVTNKENSLWGKRVTGGPVLITCDLLRNDQTIRFGYHDPSSVFRAIQTTGQRVQDTAWHHIAVCREKFSQKVIKVYMDGELVAYRQNPEVMRDIDSVLSFGRFTLNTPIFRGFESFAPPLWD
jgi:hypothetical protein